VAIKIETSNSRERESRGMLWGRVCVGKNRLEIGGGGRHLIACHFNAETSTYPKITGGRGEQRKGSDKTTMGRIRMGRERRDENTTGRKRERSREKAEN